MTRRARCPACSALQDTPIEVCSVCGWESPLAE